MKGATKPTYRVEAFRLGVWRVLPATEGRSHAYVKAFNAGMRQFYPCPETRIVKVSPDGALEVLTEFPANGKVETQLGSNA